MTRQSEVETTATAFADDSGFEFEVFFDGDCPLCRREIEFLQRRDRRDRLRFTDIAEATFDAESETGRSFDTLMARIHGRGPDGEIVEGVEVFRRLYSAVGWSWLVAPTRWPVLRSLADFGYRMFARYRLRLTGRCRADGSACRVPSTDETKSP